MMTSSGGIEMREISVVFENYNEESLERGLGVKIDAISDEELSKLLSFALGYVDYEKPRIAKELFGMMNEPGLNKPFLELYKEGKVNEYYIDHEIEKWHASETDQAIHEFLGMSLEEYSRYVQEEKLPEVG